jgi:hypothetical protein
MAGLLAHFLGNERACDAMLLPVIVIPQDYLSIQAFNA